MKHYIQNFAIKNKAVAGYGYDMNASNMPTLVNRDKVYFSEGTT
jgi:hypothetical protein